MNTTPQTIIRDIQGFLEPEQVEQIIKAAPTQRDCLLIKTLWNTGSRISEVVSPEHGTTPRDLVRGPEDIIVMRTLKRIRKDSRARPPERRVVIPRALMDSLKDFSKNTPPDSRIFPISRQRAFELVRRAARLAGIDRVGNKKMHPHVLRHSHAVAYLRADNTIEGLRKLQARLGHASFYSTVHYLQFSQKGEDKKIEEIFG